MKDTAITSLPGPVRALRARFSPDGDRLAVITSEAAEEAKEKARWHVRILDSLTGKTDRELLAYDSYPMNQPGAPLWTADAEYVLVPEHRIGPWTEGRIHLWNARTGRHRADFWFPTLVSGGLVLDAKEKELLAGTQDGLLLVWNFQFALKEVRALERSLNQKQR